MIFKKLFPHLDVPKHRTYLASHVLNFFGRVFIKGPTPDDWPAHLPLKTRIHLAKTHFYLPVNRMPPGKAPEGWGVGQLRASIIRNLAEEPKAAHASAIVSLWAVVLILGVVSIGQPLSQSIKEASAKREAVAQAKERAEYQENNEAQIAKWTSEAEGYSAQQCVREVEGLRIRNTEQRRDRYAAIEGACQSKSDDIRQIGQTMPFNECLALGKGIINDIDNRNGTQTWTDSLIFTSGCARRFGRELETQL